MRSVPSTERAVSQQRVGRDIFPRILRAGSTLSITTGYDDLRSNWQVWEFAALTDVTVEPSPGWLLPRFCRSREAPPPSSFIIGALAITKAPEGRRAFTDTSPQPDWNLDIVEEPTAHLVLPRSNQPLVFYDTRIDSGRRLNVTEHRIISRSLGLAANHST